MLLSKNLIDSVLPSNLKQLLDEGGAGKVLISYIYLTCVKRGLMFIRKLEHCRWESTAKFESI